MNINYWILFLAFLILACQTKQQEKVANKMSLDNSKQERYPESPIYAWLDFTNSKSSENPYTEQTVHINATGEYLVGKTGFIEAALSIPIIIDSFNILFSVVASNDSVYRYEIGSFWAKNQGYTYLMIWKTLAGKSKLELEFISQTQEFLFSKNLLDPRRDEWMQYCNNHQVSLLVKNLYTAQAIYYNHKPVIVGTDPIIKEYQYMNKENYQLALRPLFMEAVNDRLIIEIGQGSGSFGGKYILIWQKSADGIWRVMMDSNI